MMVYFTPQNVNAAIYLVRTGSLTNGEADKPQNFVENIVGIANLVRHSVRTVLAFTHSDFKTIVVPVIVYAIMATPSFALDVAHFPRLAAWIFIHLLEFCAANQMYTCQEDAVNKPYRPLPSGLITAEGAFALRWTLAPLCLGLSFLWGVPYPGIALATSFIAYNELGFDSYWYTKSFLNAIGIVSWNVGAASIARSDASKLSDNTWIAPYLSVALIWTTMHIQDFRDEAGDRLQGRVTIPILMPEWSRRLTPFLILAWSIGLTLYWTLEPIRAAVFVALGMNLALRIFFLRKEHDDKVSLRAYMIWLTIAQVSPFWSNNF